MSNTKQEKSLLLNFQKKDFKYNISLQFYQRKLDSINKSEAFLLLNKSFFEENEDGAIFVTKISLDPQKEQENDYEVDVITILQKELVFQLNNQGGITNIYNIGEIKDFWDEQKQKLYKKYVRVDFIKNKIQEIDFLLSNQKEFLQYILNQEMYHLLFPSIYNTELVVNKPLSIDKQYSNTFKNTILPVSNFSILEDIETKEGMALVYEIETINNKKFDSKLLLEENKKKYNTGVISLEHNTTRNYSISTSGHIHKGESLRKTEISEFEKKEQITQVNLLIQSE